MALTLTACCLFSRSRKKMQNVSNLSILAMLIMYMLSALFGYLTFYGKSAVTLEQSAVLTDHIGIWLVSAIQRMRIQ